ncbi:MAG TPA: hypothetical protein DEF21_06100 [Thalassospira lucentensis]|uniref:Uncharacterized protein n=1 Tax=Thalassospira lucentensis TaxID=168935 RepID=A0A358HQN2_9PROT|nr:hypothetical protein [Thalassospira lucentensis]HCW68063.1 hypothetical protein [Thalassospira lucentensis]
MPKKKVHKKRAANARPPEVLNIGSGPTNLIGMADVIFVKSKEKPAVRAGIPAKGFDAGVCKYNVCPLD